MSEAKEFRVIIVGGGVAGLALANCLQHAGIDFLVLEGREEIHPQVGASIGLFPNGLRILDQLGCYEDLWKEVEPITVTADRDANAKLLHGNLDGLQLAASRFGYSCAFGDRQTLLQILYEHIKEKDKVLTGKRIAAVEDLPEGISVTCADGYIYTGDVLAGADGVHSRVRQEMWRIADIVSPGLISSEEKHSMTAEYKCMYGICSPIPDVNLAGQYNVTYMKDKDAMVIGGKEGKLYVFLFEKMDKTYRIPDIPRYTDQDAEEFGDKHAEIKVLPNLTFGRLWANRTTCTLVALEESDFKTWTFGRIACLGDNVHKMTPDAGQGGNSAIESAAAMTNVLKALLDKTQGRPTKPQVETSLKLYQESRATRMPHILKTCNKLTRLHAMKTWLDGFFVTHIAHRLGDMPIDMQSDMIIGAHMLDFLPPPKRSLLGTMPFNPEQGEGYKESKLKRAFFTIPLIIMLYLGAYKVFTLESLAPVFEHRLSSGKVEWATGSVPLLDSFYRIGWLDEIWKPLVAFFATSLYGYDLKAHWQAISFFCDLGPLLAIFYIESTRRSNAMTLAQVPLLFGLLAQLRGVGVIAPLYFIPHYIFTPVSAFKATDMRLTSVAYTSAVLPSLLLTYYIPTLTQYLHPSLPSRQAWNWLWQMFPVWISASAWGIQKLFFTDTIMHDRKHDPKRDLSVMKWTLGTCIAISSISWWCALALSSASPFDLFIPRQLPINVTGGIDELVFVVLQWDEVLLFANVSLWLALLFWDMKYVGMVKESWVLLGVKAGAVLVLLGPGAVLGLAWLVREDAITNKRHRAAVTEAWVSAERRDGMAGEHVKAE